jgi:hypothetical protein
MDRGSRNCLFSTEARVRSCAPHQDSLSGRSNAMNGAQRNLFTKARSLKYRRFTGERKR